jgi:uncharacterized protein (DUF1800 family)
VADSNRVAIAWLHRRAAWGLAPGELDARLADGVGKTIDRLVDPDRAGVPQAPDAWANVDLSVPKYGRNQSTAQKAQVREQLRQQGINVIEAWLDHFVSTPRPLEDWMTWFWHGHFVSGLDKVKLPSLMVQQLRTFRSLALAPFPELVRAATIDSAMLQYLDGDTSTGEQPNENYGRELLELFTLGIGNYTEDDVQAGARALTGWTVPSAGGPSRFVASRHDNAREQYLGVADVHDVDSVVDAVTSHPKCAPFIAGELAKTILGPSVDPGFVAQLAADFAASGLDTRELVRSILAAGAMSHGVEAVNEPVPWLVAAQRATDAAIAPAQRLRWLRAAGQLPLYPPNVAGWPSGTTWFGASTVVARYDLAAAIVKNVPDGNPALAAARSFDLDALADALGHPEGFATATQSAFAPLKGDPEGVLALALCSPELSLA